MPLWCDFSESVLMKQWTETLVSSDWVDIGGLIFNRVDVSFFFFLFLPWNNLPSASRVVYINKAGLLKQQWKLSASGFVVTVSPLVYSLTGLATLWHVTVMRAVVWTAAKPVGSEKKGKRERGSSERKWLMGKMKSNFLYTKQPPEEKRRPCSPLTGDVSPSVCGFAASLFYFSS